MRERRIERKENEKNKKKKKEDSCLIADFISGAHTSGRWPLLIKN